jgi:hypothetical protein
MDAVSSAYFAKIKECKFGNLAAGVKFVYTAMHGDTNIIFDVFNCEIYVN